jgi:hypothetical protein
MGSDGLFDNLTDMMIGDCLPEKPIMTDSKEFLNVKSLSSCIANKAESFSLQDDYDSPFAQGARKHGKRYKGGKQDDITVIVSQIKLQA